MTIGITGRTRVHKQPVIRLHDMVEPYHLRPTFSKAEREFYEDLYRRRGLTMPDAPTNGEVYRIFKSFDPLARIRKRIREQIRHHKRAKLREARAKKDKATKTSTDDMTKTKKVRLNKDKATTSTDKNSKTLMEKQKATTSTDDALSH